MDALTAHLGPARVLWDYTASGLGDLGCAATGYSPATRYHPWWLVASAGCVSVAYAKQYAAVYGTLE